MSSDRTNNALYLVAVVACYAAAAFGVGLILQSRAFFPTGADALTHLYKSQALLAGVQGGASGPVLDLMWDNGEQLLLSWPPLPVLVLAGCLALAQGSAVTAFALVSGIALLVSGATGAVMGVKLRRRALGAVVGGLWFALPNNSYLLFVSGDIPATLALVLLPALIFCAWWWIQRRTPATLALISLIMAEMLLCQPADAALIACALGVYLVAYGIANRSVLPQFWVAGAAACGFLIACIWLAPSLGAGGTIGQGLKLAQPSAGNWAVLLDPVAYATQQGYGCYVGLAALVLIVLGILTAPWKQVPAFATALVALIVAPFALGAAGGALAEYQLWQLSLPVLASVVLGFTLTGLALWGSIRIGLAAAFCAVFALGAVPGALGALSGSDGANAQANAWLEAQTTDQGRNDGALWAAARLSELAGTHHPAHYPDALPLLEEAKGLTSQRLSIVSGYGRADGLSYAASGKGLLARQAAVPPIALAQGADWESSTLAGSYRLLNEALEEGDYLYLFDRNVELGCDTVLVRTPAAEGFDSEELGRMDIAAQRAGYRLADANSSYRLYHLSGAPASFGSTAAFSAIAIGRSADATTLGFPSAVRGDSDVLDDYTFEELSAYQTVLVCSVDYRDQQTAEDLVRRLAENGTRVVVLADGIPENRTTHDRIFLGVRCNEITFNGGYPELDTIDGTELPDLFPLGTGAWRTVYLEGLDKVWGTIDESDLGHPLDFIGTVENDNIVFVGLNLTYYYSMTRNDFAGTLLSHALSLSPQELPKRTLQPVQMAQSDGSLSITAQTDSVATGLSWFDGLESDTASEHRGQVFVDTGTAQVKAVRPYAAAGTVLALAGIVLLGLLVHAARLLRQRTAGTAAQTPGEATPHEAEEE